MTEPERGNKLRDVARDEQRSVFREAILSAAEQVFGQMGFHDSKMTDIAQAAGVAAGTLYNYFKSKEEVFEAILNRTHERLFMRMNEQVSIEDPLERMRAFMRTTYEYLEENGAMIAVFFRISGLARWTTERMDEACHERMYARYLKLLEQALREAVKRGFIRNDLAVGDLVIMFSGLCDSYIFAWARGGCKTGLVHKIDRVFSLFLQGARKNL